ncbi:MAG TPA: tryptophan synthase subunit beta [Candidatus Woesebacteria bacterium]|nr:tryptophan synthase subunit beta [Candidatus Woesebacteria bacterium]
MKQKYNLPTRSGYFGEFGGLFVPPQLEKVLKELEKNYLKFSKDPEFLKELQFYYANYANRPSPLYFAKNLTESCGGAKIYLKREDLNHTGAHKINNAIGQALLAKRIGKTKLIAETGAGQHGVATATVAALFGMKCDVYMGKRDMVNQKINVYKIKLLGARVIEVISGQGTLKDAVDEALNAYAHDTESFYLLGSAVGPHPYPMMVRNFQKIIGEETKKQILAIEKRLPDYLVACVGGGSNSIGLFYDFIDNQSVEMIGVEPAGKGINTDRHGLSLLKGKIGVIHGFKCLLLQDRNGQIKESYSAASGLDYPGVGPEHCYLKSIGRLQNKTATDLEATKAFQVLSKTEGIIPALESAHAIAYGIKLAKTLSKDKIVVINLSGRGDKDVENVYENLLPRLNVKISL